MARNNLIKILQKMTRKNIVTIRNAFLLVGAILYGSITIYHCFFWPAFVRDSVESDSAYKATPSISNLLKERTLDFSKPPFTRDIPYYNADGHGFFDSITVLNEELLFTPYYICSFVFYIVPSQTLLKAYFSLRGIENSSAEDLAWYDLIPAMLFFFIPQTICDYGVALVLHGAVYVYDFLFHDVPVLLTKAIVYPFAKAYEFVRGKKPPKSAIESR